MVTKNKNFAGFSIPEFPFELLSANRLQWILPDKAFNLVIVLL